MEELLKEDVNEQNVDQSYQGYESRLSKICSSKEPNLKVIKHLFALGTNPNICFKRGPTPLILLSKQKTFDDEKKRRNLIKIILFLIKSGGNPFLATSNKKNCFGYLFKRRELHLIHQILITFFETKIQKMKIKSVHELKVTNQLDLYLFLLIKKHNFKKIEELFLESYQKSNMVKRQEQGKEKEKEKDKGYTEENTQANLFHLLFLFLFHKKTQKMDEITFSWLTGFIIKFKFTIENEINKKMFMHLTILHEICIFGLGSPKIQLNLIKILSNTFTELNFHIETKFGDNALHLICLNKHYNHKDSNFEELFDYISSKFQKIHFKNNFHQIPLYYLYYNPKPKKSILQLMVDRGYNLIQRNNKNENILHLLTKKKPNIPIKIIKMLIHNGVNINCEDINNSTPLHNLCSLDPLPHIDVFKYFFKMGADHTITNKQDYTPLQLLCMSKYVSLDIIKLFIKHGANYLLVTNSIQNLLYLVCKHCDDIFCNINDIDQSSNNNSNNTKKINNDKNKNNKNNSKKNNNNKNKNKNNINKNNNKNNNNNTNKNKNNNTTTKNKNKNKNNYNKNSHDNKNSNKYDQNEKLKIINFFINQNLNINLQDTNGITPLAILLKNKNNNANSIKTIEYLIIKGATIYHTSNNERFIFLLLCQNKYSTFKLLKYLYLKTKIDYNQIIHHDYNLLQTILYQNPDCNLKFIQFLIDQGYDLNNAFGKDQNTPLHCLCLSNPTSTNMLQLLLKNGVLVNQLNKIKRVPLHCLCNKKINSLPMLKLLIDNNSKMNNKDNLLRTPLHLHLQYRQYPTIETTSILIQSGSNVNHQDYEGKTPLHLYCNQSKYKFNFEIIKLIIKNGMDINLKDNKKQTILHILCKNQELPFKILLFLKQNGANFKSKNILKNTPFHLICKNFYNTNLLIRDFGNLVDGQKMNKIILLKNSHNQTMFHLICKNPKIALSGDLIKLFLKFKPKLKQSDKFGKTIFNYYLLRSDCKLKIIEEFVKCKVNIHLISKKEKWNSLHVYLQNKNCSLIIIKKLFDLGVNLNQLDYLNRTPLNIICGLNYIDFEKKFNIIKFLFENTDLVFLDNNMDNTKHAINTDNNKNCNKLINTPLHSLCGLTNPPFNIIQYFIKKNMSVNLLNEQKLNALQVLLKNESFKKIIKKLPIIEFFIENNSIFPLYLKFKRNLSKNKKHSNTNSLFLLICQYSTPSIILIKKFFQKKIQLNIHNNINRTPLHLICLKPNPSIASIKLFIQNNANINLKDHYSNTPLHYICKKKNPSLEIIKLFLDHGSILGARNNDGKTAFHLLCSNINDDNQVSLLLIIKLFLQRGIDLNMQTYSNSILARSQKFYMNQNTNINSLNKKNYTGKSALHFLFDSNDPPIKIIKYLIKKGANLSLSDINNFSPIHYFCNRNSPSNKCLIYLINIGFNFNFNKITPFHLLALNENPNINTCKLLVPFINNLNQPIFKKKNLLQWICEKNPSLDILNLLFQYGANIHTVNKKNQSLLHIICSKYCPPIDIIKLLIEYKIDINHQDHKSRTSLILIIRKMARINCFKMNPRNYIFDIY
ncbi:ankyrin repeat [Anaeramoeba flamelloides]|uniref:Ankyrin repeat n=1 Tax=Anaeramoeba flamelloides TaxID=1746091 RepID=A0ABQ8Z2U0_9EUKA|nr:ankyrin repeat [Anaeramoeba flamelloides]